MVFGDRTRAPWWRPASCAVVSVVAVSIVVGAATLANANGGRTERRDTVHVARRMACVSTVAADDTEDDPFDFLRDAFAPAVLTLFDDLEQDLRATGTPLPRNVRRLLARFFTDESAGGIRLTPAVLERAVFVVDAERMRDVFAFAPRNTAAITVGDTIAFTGGNYQPDCIEGVALIGHELVHVAQYAALGKQTFLDRYFLKDTLQQVLTGDDAEEALDASRNPLEVAAYCHEERICRALAVSGGLEPCNGRTTARCAACPRPAPARQPKVSAGRSGRKSVPTR